MKLTLTVTHQCNCACVYCYTGAKSDRWMTLEVAERALELADFHDEEGADIAFFGGEPLLDLQRLRGYTELVYRKAEVLGATAPPRLSLTTNGTRLGPEALAFLREYDFEVGLSLDGDRLAHEATRPLSGGASSFDQVMRALALLLESDLRTETISVIDPLNVNRLGLSVAWLVEAGVEQLILNPNFGADWSTPAREAWARGYDEAAEIVLASYRRGCPVSLNVLDEKIWGHIDPSAHQRSRCGFGRTEVTVAPSGNLYPCERLVADDVGSEWVIGTLADGFSSRRDELIALTDPSPSACGTCAVASRCMNWCACQNLADSGRIDAPGELVCWHDQVAMEVADRLAATLYADKNPLFVRRFYPSAFGGPVSTGVSPRKRGPEGDRGAS